MQVGHKRLALAVLVTVQALAGGAAGAAAAEAPGKIAPSVRAAAAKGERPHFLLVLREQADLSAAARLRSKAEKGAFVYQALRAVADRTQPAVRAVLDRRGLRYRAYYIVNMLAIEGGSRQDIERLASREDVARIEADPEVRVALPTPAVALDRAPLARTGIEWGVSKINAPQVWAMGYRGRGIVYANADTGVQWDHPALQRRYRGWNRHLGVADHNFNWWDAIHADVSGNGGNPCGFSSSAPCDDDGHGTHTMGTGVGDDGAGNQIGVAPRARWIACRNMDEGVGRPSFYIECFQFFLAPWDLNTQNADPAKAPDVISNSWGCPLGPPPGGEECTPTSLRQAVKVVRRAGIFVAVSAGNSGPTCSTVADPPAHYNAATTVGATDSSDALAGFSSRGPVTIDGSNRLKPDISAPGVSVRSSYPPNTYASLSGTSMASPHLAGAVALLWNARPALRGNVQTTETVLFTTANPSVTAAGTCGGTGNGTIPNNLFGYGRVDVLAAVNSVP